MQEIFRKAASKLDGETGAIAFVAHQNPDGDAIGSVLALTRFLSHRGKRAVPVCTTDVPDRFRFLPGAEGFRSTLPDASSLVVLVDTPDQDRAGISWQGPVMKIDHHSNGALGPWDIVFEDAASTANIVLWFMRYWNEAAIDRDTALCLYTGILTDTNGFTVRVNPSVLKDAAWLLELGLDAHWIADMVYRQRRVQWVRLLSMVLPSLRVEMQGKFAFVVVRHEDFAATGAKGHEAENIVDYPFSIKGVALAAKIQQDREKWRVSLRSRGEVSAERVAKALGGGGHYHAAGAVVSADFDQVMERLRAAAAEELGL